MAPHKYISKEVLFDDEEEWNKKVTRYDVYGRHKTVMQRHQEYLERKQQVLDSTHESTVNVCRLLKETEDCGISSAKELHRQGEVLRNTNQRLTEMDADLKTSEQHISGIESVFKSLKNRITGKSKRIRKSLKKNNKQKKEVSNEETKADTATHYATRTHSTAQKDAIQKVDINDKEKLIQNNLNEIADSVHRLKDIGIAMGEEIQKQNVLLDGMILKADKSEVKLENHTKLIKKLK